MKVVSRSVNETINIGKLVARHLEAGDIVCLFGHLGSGKTVLTKGIAAGLGIKKEIVNSPSFVLLRQHSGDSMPLYHFDLYRLNSPKDILGLGYQEYLYDEGVSVIEWADRLGYLTPGEFFKIELFLRPGSERLLKFSGVGLRYRELCAKIDEDIRH